MPLTEMTFPDMPTAAKALADEIITVLKLAIAEKGNAVLAVSGGRTPAMVFRHLRQAALDWEKVSITLTDERWVPAEHSDSNENLVKTHLLQENAAVAKFVPLYGGEATPMAGQTACEARLSALSLPIDAVYLGMGPDGHFASLFPGDKAVTVMEGNCIGVAETADRLPRMSLTAPAILNARQVFLLFNGTEKHQKYQEAQTAGDAQNLPLRLLFSDAETVLKVLSAP